MSASAAIAANDLRWQLGASVPVTCAINAVETRPTIPITLVVATTCNAERYQLVVSPADGPPDLRAARSSAGPAQIDGDAVTISSNSPGYALTTIELAEPGSAGPFAVTLQPL